MFGQHPAILLLIVESGINGNPLNSCAHLPQSFYILFRPHGVSMERKCYPVLQ